ncbi:MAG: succinate dehydrogenase cytochrome b558 subunit [Pirellulaceae bacterium]
MSSTPSFWSRNEFLIRRLHSLTGLVPVGAYLCMHLGVNATVAVSPAMFQRLVFQIHALGDLLPLVEWVFIFLPLIFHGVVGLFITRGGLPNTQAYPYDSNFRYTMQRATGMIAFVYIAWHVFHMHGWIHYTPWLDYVAIPLHGGKFAPYNAGSTAAEAMQQSFIVPVIYGIGVLATVYHFANGIFTMGITWGVWISPQAQERAKWASTVFGAVLAVVGLSSIIGLQRMENLDEVRQRENQQYEALVITGDIPAKEHKRAHQRQNEFMEETLNPGFQEASPQVPTDPSDVDPETEPAAQ